MTGDHLKDERFTWVLSGDGTQEDLEHLDHCERCRRELEQVRSAIDSFGELSLAWAEQRAPELIPAPSALTLRWQTTGRRMAAAAILLAAALFFGFRHEKTPRTPDDDQASVAATAEASQEVADDNRLMMAIDEEIRWQADLPVSLEELEAARPSRSRPAHRSAN